MIEPPMCDGRAVYFPYRSFRVYYFEVHIVIEIQLPERASFKSMIEGVLLMGMN